MTMALVFASVLVTASDPAVDLESLRNLMDGLQRQLKDIEFVYEGSVSHPSDAKEVRPVMFQGEFAFRTDGSVHLNIYQRREDERLPLRRTILCLSNRSKLEQVDFYPDLGKGSKHVKAATGGLPSLEREATPFRIFLAPKLLEYLRDSGGLRTNNQLNYEDVGWETTDGHRCLKIRIFSAVPAGGPPFQEHIYWIDMKRSANPIKYEYKIQGDVWARADSITLETFTLPDGGSVWLPVHGVFQSFVSHGKRSGGEKVRTESRPTTEEVYKVVNGTAFVNQNLPDKRFTVGWSAPPRSPGIRTAQAEFDAIPPRPRRTSAQARVTELVTNAEEQVHTLEASAPSRERLSWNTVGAIGLPVFGGVCLVSAWAFKRRYQ